MKIENPLREKPVKVTNHGMVTIPAALRRRYQLQDGDRVLIVEDEGTLKIIPIRTLAELRQEGYSSAEMRRVSRQLKTHELELER